MANLVEKNDIAVGGATILARWLGVGLRRRGWVMGGGGCLVEGEGKDGVFLNSQGWIGLNI